MHPIRNPGRIAGLWYLAVILAGLPRLMLLPNKLFVANAPAATAASILAHEPLFRLGIVADLASAILLVLLTLAFYRLFATTSRDLAAQVVLFGGIMPSLLYFVGITADLGVLRILHPLPGATYLAAFTLPQQQALAYLFLKLRDSLNTAAETLWGVWLFPLATLVYRSRFLPRFLGVWLFLGGLGYLAVSVTGALWPAYQNKVLNDCQPVFLGEIALTLWLLIRGATPSPATAR
jgi:hypothetical protein